MASAERPDVIEDLSPVAFPVPPGLMELNRRTVQDPFQDAAES